MLLAGHSPGGTQRGICMDTWQIRPSQGGRIYAQESCRSRVVQAQAPGNPDAGIPVWLGGVCYVV